MKLSEKNVGEFELKSNKLFVTDPCYDKSTWCTHTIEDAKPGVWDSAVIVSDEGVWGHRVAELRAWNIAHAGRPANEKVEADIGVDSGQCGFFDYDKFPSEPADYDDLNGFYRRACNETYDEKRPGKRAGIVDGFGVASSSGFGDGSYDLYVGRDTSGQVVSAKIVFIDEDKDDDFD